MSEKITIAVLAGTKREQRKSFRAAHYVAALGQELPDTEIIFVDPKDFNFPGDGNDPEGKDARYTEITAKADAFFIVTPEYNHSFPGSLKRMLDSELANYNHKPVMIAGVSDGNWGGVRAVEALIGTVREMGLVATATPLYFPRVLDIFDEDGQMNSDYVELYNRNIMRAYKELLWFARTLKYGREHIAPPKVPEL